MSIIKDGIETYKGQVISTSEHMWMDGMVDEFAHIWDMDEHCSKTIQYGYYGADGRNLYGNSYAEVDLTEEVRRDILRTIKASAPKAFADSVVAHKKGIRKGTHAEVVRGRKIPKGTIVEVFWVGEKETYRSRQYAWMHEYETIAGCYDEDGNKVWVKAEYLKSIDKIKSPCAAERKKFIKAYIERQAREYGIRVR